MLFLKAITLSLASLGMATTFQAFGSSDCSSAGGSVITVAKGGTCSNVEGRQSYKVIGDNCNVWEFNVLGCQESGQWQKYYRPNGSCRTGMSGIRSCCINGSGNNGGSFTGC